MNKKIFGVAVALAASVACACSRPRAADNDTNKRADAATASDAALRDVTAALTDATPDKTCVNPIPGKYVARSTPPIAADAWYGSDPIYPLNHGGFTIEVDQTTGLLSFPFSADGYRWDTISVSCGEFSHQWGQNLGGIHCPTDGYRITGAFVSPTEVHGHYVAMSSCEVRRESDFIAVLHVPDAATSDTATSADLVSADMVLPPADAVPMDTADVLPIPDAAPDKPCVSPLPGKYSARVIPDDDGTIGVIRPLDTVGFTVETGGDAGGLVLVYWSDPHRYDRIPIVCGGVNHSHGQVWGTNCPTDGYSINGSFVSPTEFRGHYMIIYTCRNEGEGEFVATLVVPDAAVAETATIDSGAIDR